MQALAKSRETPLPTPHLLLPPSLASRPLGEVVGVIGLRCRCQFRRTPLLAECRLSQALRLKLSKRFLLLFRFQAH